MEEQKEREEKREKFKRVYVHKKKKREVQTKMWVIDKRVGGIGVKKEKRLEEKGHRVKDPRIHALIV